MKIIAALLLFSSACIDQIIPAGDAGFWSTRLARTTSETHQATLHDPKGKVVRTVAIKAPGKEWNVKGDLVWSEAARQVFGKVSVVEDTDCWTVSRGSLATSFPKDNELITWAVNAESDVVAKVSWHFRKGIEVTSAVVGKAAKTVLVEHRGKPVEFAGEMSAVITKSGKVVFFGRPPDEPSALTFHRNPNEEGDRTARFSLYAVSLTSGDADRLCDVHWIGISTARYASREDKLVAMGDDILMCTGLQIWKLTLASGMEER